MELATIAEPMPISCKDSARRAENKMEKPCFYIFVMPSRCLSYAKIVQTK